MNITYFEQTAGSFLFFFLLLLVVVWIAQRNQFFKLPPPMGKPPVLWRHLAGAFLVYLAAAVLVAVMTRFIRNFPKRWDEWEQLVGLSFMFLVLVGYCFLMNSRTRHFIFWGEGKASLSRFWKTAGMGVIGWTVSYPFVLISSFVTNLISKWLWGETESEQVAVKHLKMTIGNTPLFVAMVFVIILIVPFIEEFLFRGLLQNLLKRYLSRGWAITLTAVIFACVHFSSSQGIMNFQLILSLLALSGFLGFIYERERTLWASYGLHATFNAINVIAITLSQSQ
jgi:uncharacterized protein